MGYGKNAYRGKFSPQNPSKYVGDVDNIIFRSSWERNLFRWCDMNSDVLQYSSEEIVIPYRSKVDGKMHRYFVDMVIKFKTGAKVLVEVKPESFLKMPKKGKNQMRFIDEAKEYAKNVAKWQAADEWAKKHDMVFQVWTQETLRKIGIVING